LTETVVELGTTSEANKDNGIFYQLGTDKKENAPPPSPEKRFQARMSKTPLQGQMFIKCSKKLCPGNAMAERMTLNG
jgi:hypothetical protein